MEQNFCTINESLPQFFRKRNTDVRRDQRFNKLHRNITVFILREVEGKELEISLHYFLPLYQFTVFCLININVNMKIMLFILLQFYVFVINSCHTLVSNRRRKKQSTIFWEHRLESICVEEVWSNRNPVQATSCGEIVLASFNTYCNENRRNYGQKGEACNTHGRGERCLRSLGWETCMEDPDLYNGSELSKGRVLEISGSKWSPLASFKKTDIKHKNLVLFTV
jgi:hypothetical protein